MKTLLTHPPCLDTRLLRNALMAPWTVFFSSGDDFMI